MHAQAWTVTLGLYCQYCTVNRYLSESQLSDTVIIQTSLLSYTLLCFFLMSSSLASTNTLYVPESRGLQKV